MSYDLSRFVTAQSFTYPVALSELHSGCKRTHWMWFVFPQLVGLGRSSMAERYGIVDMGEARAYLDHPVLGARLQEATAAVLAHRGMSARLIFGSPDDMKFHSSMTLFALASGEGSVFVEALEGFFSGKRDGATLRLLGMS
jgi:uncharacterized protein (DUF1810 family)